MCILNVNALDRFLTNILPSLLKRGGKVTKYDNQVLMKIFNINPYPQKEEIHQLAKSLVTSEKKIKRWFKNMRYQKKGNRELLKRE